MKYYPFLIKDFYRSNRFAEVLAFSKDYHKYEASADMSEIYQM
jgi:hypothetical protein